MLTIQILEKTDLIQPKDWCRPLYLQSMSGGYSDSYSFKSQYSGTPENNLKWVRAEDIFGDGWFDNVTLGQLCDDIQLEYEFVRGNIPEANKLDMSDYGSVRGYEPDYDDFEYDDDIPF